MEKQSLTIPPILVPKNRLGIGTIALLTSAFLRLPFPYRNALPLATTHHA